MGTWGDPVSRSCSESIIQVDPIQHDSSFSHREHCRDPPVKLVPKPVASRIAFGRFFLIARLVAILGRNQGINLDSLPNVFDCHANNFN